MPSFDATTLLLVNAVFNVYAALVWASLAGLFRIAPATSLMLAAAHLLALPALFRSPCLAEILPARLPAWLPAVSTVLMVTLLAAALRRLLRLERRQHELLLIGGLTALGLLAIGMMQEGPAAQTSTILRGLTGLGIALLSLLACRDVLRAMEGGSRWSTLLLLLPFGGLLLFSSARLLALGRGDLDTGVLSRACRVETAPAWIWLLLSLSLVIALVTLVLRRLLQRIEQLTRTDSLTGTMNRRAIDEQLHRLQAQLRRGHAYALMVLDLDHFKRINDELGHAAGDAALLHVVAQMKACCRAGDSLGRLGGEEFCLLMPHTRLAEAARLAEQVRAALAAHPFPWQGRTLPLTASLGVSPGLTGDAGGVASLAAADAQLYRAKAEGRNRVCTAPGAQA